MIVLVLVLSTFLCNDPPCSISISNRKYRELVFDPDLPFQSYATLPLQSHDRLRLPTNAQYWTEAADGWMSHKLSPTFRNRTIDFKTTSNGILTVLTRGIDPIVMVDEKYTNFRELFKVPLSAGTHQIVWITDNYIDPQRGDGYQEPVQTAAWVRFTHRHEAIEV